MWEVEENVVGQMLRKQDRTFSTAGWTKVETLAGERPEVVMSAIRVCTADAREALEVVTARRESLADTLDAFETVHAVGGGILFVVLLAEVVEVPFEDRMEFVSAAGDIALRGCRGHGNGGAHMS